MQGQGRQGDKTKIPEHNLAEDNTENQIRNSLGAQLVLVL